MFIVKDDCPNLARTFPILQWAKNNLDDVDSSGEDHAFDAARYALMADRNAAYPHVPPSGVVITA
jgi:hypothetical protein